MVRPRVTRDLGDWRPPKKRPEQEAPLPEKAEEDEEDER